jgi:hypothetical protein
MLSAQISTGLHAYAIRRCHISEVFHALSVGAVHESGSKILVPCYRWYLGLATSPDSNWQELGRQPIKNEEGLTSILAL